MVDALEPNMDGLGTVKIAHRAILQPILDENWEAAWDAITAYGLAVHDACCVECHNADIRDRCPRRQQLTRLDSQDEEPEGGSEPDKVCRYYP